MPFLLSRSIAMGRGPDLRVSFGDRRPQAPEPWLRAATLSFMPPERGAGFVFGEVVRDRLSCG